MTCIHMAMQKILYVFHVICAFLKIFYRSVAPITTQSKYIFSAPSLIPPSTIPLEEVILCLKMNKRKEWAIIPVRMHLVRSFYSAKSLFALFFVLCLGLSSALITTFRRTTSFLSLAQNSVGDLQGFLCVLYNTIQEFSIIQIRSPPNDHSIIKQGWAMKVDIHSFQDCSRYGFNRNFEKLFIKSAKKWIL